jgi:hypothetical protein
VNKGTLVLLNGIVRGMGQEAQIEVLTRRVQDHNAGGALPSYTYVDCTVIGDPANLPDGDYIASFAGFSSITTRRNGMWLSSGIAVPDKERTFIGGEEAEAEQPMPRHLSKEEPETEPLRLELSPQCNCRRSFLV